MMSQQHRISGAARLHDTPGSPHPATPSLSPRFRQEQAEATVSTGTGPGEGLDSRGGDGCAPVAPPQSPPGTALAPGRRCRLSWHSVGHHSHQRTPGPGDTISAPPAPHGWSAQGAASAVLAVIKRQWVSHAVCVSRVVGKVSSRVCARLRTCAMAMNGPWPEGRWPRARAGHGHGRSLVASGLGRLCRRSVINTHCKHVLITVKIEIKA